MKTQVYILLSLKTLAGFETYGQYFLGNDPEAAAVLFESLKGSTNLPDHGMLHIDLMETVDELPVKVKSISCSLDELAYNIKMITREIFRVKNLRAYEE